MFRVLSPRPSIAIPPLADFTPSPNTRVWKFPRGILPKQTSTKFGSQTPKLLRNPSRIRSFEKGLADGGGWREEILPMPEIQASFLHSFSIPPMRRATHFWGPFLAVFLGPASRQPPPANPFSKPLTEAVPCGSLSYRGVTTLMIKKGTN